MKTSFDEIKRMSFRALDAAGAPQGVDEESAHAAAWLEASGLPGLQMLADALDGSTLAERRTSPEPDIAGGRARVDAEGRSAVFLGPGLADLMLWLMGERGEDAAVEIARLRHAGFLQAFAGQAANRGSGFRLVPDHPGDEPTDIVLVASADDGSPDENARTAQRTRSCEHGIDAADDAFERVYAHSRRILVPETEASRLSGAGAGLTDND